MYPSASIAFACIEVLREGLEHEFVLALSPLRSYWWRSAQRPAARRPLMRTRSRRACRSSHGRSFPRRWRSCARTLLCCARLYGPPHCRAMRTGRYSLQALERRPHSPAFAFVQSPDRLHLERPDRAHGLIVVESMRQSIPLGERLRVVVLQFRSGVARIVQGLQRPTSLVPPRDLATVCDSVGQACLVRVRDGA